jgi:hypothetical protein
MRIEQHQDMSAPKRRGRRLVSPELKDRSAQFYSVRPDGGAITCRLCGFTSTHPHDIEQKFCPRCLVFHEDRILMLRLNEGFQTEFQPLNEDWSAFRSAA